MCVLEDFFPVRLDFVFDEDWPDLSDFLLVEKSSTFLSDELDLFFFSEVAR